MQDFLTLYWWVSVVIVGYLINLASAYTKPWIDAGLSRVSSRWRTRVERQRRIYEAQIQMHVHDPHLIVLAGFEQSSASFTSITLMIMAAILILLQYNSPIRTSSILSGINITLTIMCMFRAMMNLNEAGRIARLLLQIKARRQESILTALENRSTELKV